MTHKQLIIEWIKLKKYMTRLMGLGLALVPLQSFAAFTIQYSLFYDSWTDDVENFEYTRLNNAFFIGASFDKDNQFYIGPTYHSISKSHQAGSGSTASDLSVTAYGASLLYFIDKEFRWKLQLTYNFALSGDRTVAGESQDIEGSGYEAGLGFQLPLSRTFWLGATLNYHTMTISEYKVDTTATDVSESYSAIVPMITLNLFFR